MKKKPSRFEIIIPCFRGLSAYGVSVACDDTKQPPYYAHMIIGKLAFIMVEDSESLNPVKIPDKHEAEKMFKTLRGIIEGNCTNHMISTEQLILEADDSIKYIILFHLNEYVFILVKQTENGLSALFFDDETKMKELVIYLLSHLGDPAEAEMWTYTDGSSTCGGSVL